MARFESNATTSRDKLHSTSDVVYTFGGLSSMPEALELHAKIKELIVEVLMLEDVVPTDIESDEPLFVDGLGLDSIDALELAMGLEDEYGVVITDDPEKNEKIFMSVSSLAEFVVAERSK